MVLATVPDMTLSFVRLALFACSMGLWLLLATPRIVQAQSDPTILLSAEPSEVFVGDVFTITLQVNHAAENRVVPLQINNLWGPFEVRRLGSLNRLSGDDGEITSTQQILATLWSTGTFSTPPLTISMMNEQNNGSTFEAPSATITVRSVLQPGDEAIRDIKAQATLPRLPLWPWLLGATFIVAVLSAVAWWLHRRRGGPVDSMPEVVVMDRRPAHVIALEELGRIAALHLPTQRRFAEHYDLVSDTLRQYLDNEFNIPALDQTTTELRRALKGSPIDRFEQSNLLALLDEADLVKFAKVEPDFASAERLPDRAVQFIRATADGQGQSVEEISG